MISRRNLFLLLFGKGEKSRKELDPNREVDWFAYLLFTCMTCWQLRFTDSWEKVKLVTFDTEAIYENISIWPHFQIRSCCYCYCWVASVVSNSVRPHRWQPTRLPRPWDSPGKNTGVGFHFLLQCMKVKSESEVAQSCLTPETPWTAAYQASLSMGFSRQKYWSGVPLPSLK